MKKKWSKKELDFIIEMRKEGVEYKEIAKKIGCVSTNAVGMRIRKLAKQGKIKTKKKIHEENYSFKNIKREDLLKGLLIWWCEGTKPSKGNVSVEFVNSDPVLIWHFINFLRKLNVNEDKIRLRLKADIENEKKLKEFWCKKLNLPISSFNKTIPYSGDNKRKRKLKYGTLTIKYSSKKLLIDLTNKWKEIMEEELPLYLENQKYQFPDNTWGNL